MALQFRSARTEDLYAIVTMLRAHHLPTDGIGDLVREHADQFVVSELNDALIGSAALDICGSHALLRFVVVARDLATLGIGTKLVTDAIAIARVRKVESLVLVTTNAHQWFSRFGFVASPPSAVPESLAAHVDITSACPASAVYMSLTL